MRAGGKSWAHHCVCAHTENLDVSSFTNQVCDLSLPPAAFSHTKWVHLRISFKKINQKNGESILESIQIEDILPVAVHKAKKNQVKSLMTALKHPIY